MKKKLIASVLAALMVAQIVGCAAKAPETATTEVEEEITDEQTSDGEAVEEATDESDEEKGKGGTPWIDSDIKSNVTADMEVSPKDDLHLFANKEWILNNDIPEGYTSWSQYSKRGLDVKNQCIELLKDETIEGHDADLVRTYNKLILDWDARNEAGVSGIKEVYDKILAVKNIDDLNKLLTDDSTKLKVENFMGYGVGQGLNDPETYIAMVGTPSLLLNDAEEYADRSEYGDMFYGMRKDIFVYIAEKMGMAKEDAEKNYDFAIDLETKLSEKIYTTQESLSDDYYEKINNEMSFEDVAALAKVFPLADVLEANGLKYDGIYLVLRPDYFEKLDEVYTDENIEELKAWILVNYLRGYSYLLDRDTYDKINDIANEYYGVSGQVSDEEMAYDYVTNSLSASMQKVYIAKYGSEEEKQKMYDLCKQVIDTYRELLSENDWASDEVRNYAIKKLDNMKIHAAYPEKFRDTSVIDLEGCSLIEASERIAECEYNYELSLLGKKQDKEMWAEGFDILSCNAFYDPQENTINMIIGMMGEPFFSDDMSVEELYASIGAFWVGHEVSHAFDSGGAQFDADGYFRDWWTEEDKAEFDKRVQKMDDYLDTIVAFDDQHFIGSNIDTEMVADMTGLQCALRMASKVENFDYDKFFTKYAQMNVNINVYASELSQLTQDAHPLDYSRTNVPVQQFEEFYETYDVKEGDAMYLAPEDRLIIW